MKERIPTANLIVSLHHPFCENCVTLILKYDADKVKATWRTMEENSREISYSDCVSIADG
jgi:hypothetical protein